MAKRSTKQVTEEIYNEIISRKFEKYVKEIGMEIENSIFVHGEYDWIITFIAEDIRLTKKCVDKFSEIHPGFIEKSTLLQTMMFVKKQYVPNPKKSKLKEYF